MTETPTPTPPGPTGAESRAQRLSRHGHRTFLYIWTVAIIAALVILIALIVANTEKVKVSWVFGDGRISLIWLIVGSALAGWLGGVATAILYRFRTRAARR
jgi:uncharacterized integral membrane protein